MIFFNIWIYLLDLFIGFIYWIYLLDLLDFYPLRVSM